MDPLKPLPFEEAIKFWQDKVKLSPGEFAKLTAEAKIMAFAVSGIAKGEELSTVFNAIGKALKDGVSFGDFKKECSAIFDKRGWSGKRAWRVDNIFRTNIQTAYNVGRFAQLKDKGDKFYGQYDAVNDSRTRPTHAAVDGKIFPLDHPFWDQWWPPNGFRCRCSVTPVHKYVVEEEGLTVESDNPTNTLVTPVDPTTGNPLPPVQLLPDPGFGYHPGKVVHGGVVDKAMDATRLTQMPGLKGAEDHRLPAASNMKRLPPAPPLLPSLTELKSSGLSNSQAASYYRDAFTEAFGLKDGVAVFEVAGEPVIVSERMITGKGGRDKITKGDRGQYIPLFKETVTDPDEVWLTPMHNETGQVVLRRRHLRYWRGEGENLAGFSVLDIEAGVWNGVTVYDVSASQERREGVSMLDNQETGYRRGVLLYKKHQGGQN